MTKTQLYHRIVKIIKGRRNARSTMKWNKKHGQGCIMQRAMPPEIWRIRNKDPWRDMYNVLGSVNDEFADLGVEVQHNAILEALKPWRPKR